MRKAGVTDYAAFARELIEFIPDLPISFEVLSDDFDTMYAEARIIASWGGATYIKIPVTNTKGQSAVPLIRRLADEGLRLNVTALLTINQVEEVSEALHSEVPSIISVFAGRIADTGRDPMPVMREAVKILEPNANAELLWASPRELLNLLQAEECGCHIITATKDVIAKKTLIGKNLAEYSLDTVKMFFNDAVAAGYRLVD